MTQKGAPGAEVFDSSGMLNDNTFYSRLRTLINLYVISEQKVRSGVTHDVQWWSIQGQHNGQKS